MLHSLFIKNYILIDSLELELGEHLNAITGETGSGKSILIDAIGFCISGKGGAEIIKSSADSASVSLSFTNSSHLAESFSEIGIELDANEDIIITRQINKDGKKKCTVNNQPISPKALDSIVDELIIIYGQHSFSNLFKVSTHIKILDSFLQDQSIFAKLSESFKELKQIKDRIIELKITQEKTEKEADYLTHVAEELSKAKIQDNEEEELATLRTKLQQGDKQRQLIKDLLDGIRSAEISANISSMIRQMSRSSSPDLFENIHNELENAQSHIDEAENLLERLAQGESSDLSLDEIEERLFMIRGLARKYGVNPSGLNEYLKEVQTKLDQFTNCDQELSKLQKASIVAKTTYLENAKIVSKLRKDAAINIEKLVSSELSHLKMKGCDFKIDIADLSEDSITEKGFDSVKFIASTNPGTPYGSIEKIASGGEMARFMLALQVALFQNNKNLPTIIFDEIDTGIGGVVADAVGTRLKKLSDSTQVLAITHQPQVASKSTHHIVVSKIHSGLTTISSARILSTDEQIEEISRMLSGKNITDTARKAAKEMIGEVE